jgi:hypothetical protein
LGEAEVNTQIYRVHAYGGNLNPGAGPNPLREGVDNTKVCLFAFSFGSLCNLTHSSRLCSFAGSHVCS